MNVSDLILEVFYIHNPPKFITQTPCMPFVDCANIYVDCVDTYVNCANNSTNYAHTSNDYVNTSSDLVDALDTPTSNFYICLCFFWLV